VEAASIVFLEIIAVHLELLGALPHAPIAVQE